MIYDSPTPLSRQSRGEHLAAEQARRLQAIVSRQLRYVGKVTRPMDRPGFDPADPLHVSAHEAYSAVHALNARLRATPDGILMRLWFLPRKRRLFPWGKLMRRGKSVDPEDPSLLVESARIRLDYAHDRQFAVSLVGIFHLAAAVAMLPSLAKPDQMPDAKAA